MFIFIPSLARGSLPITRLIFLLLIGVALLTACVASAELQAEPRLEPGLRFIEFYSPL